MAAGDAVAGDVPGKYDVVINGKGYVFADSVEPSLPFRTHRAIYDISPTFVERSNTGQSYGDQTQDFFLTASQNDWTEGEDQRFFRIGDNDSRRKYWKGSAVDRSIPGQVSLLPATKTLTFAGAVRGTNSGYSLSAGALRLFAGSLTNIYEVSPTGVITDRGAHGTGSISPPDNLCSDGQNLFVAGGGATTLRRMDNGFTFTTFNTNTLGHGSLVYLNNTLYASEGQSLVQYDTSGTQTVIYQWKTATGATITNSAPLSMAAYGGKLLIFRPGHEAGNNPELWIYDGTAPVKIGEFPKNFHTYAPGTTFSGQITVGQGIGFIPGSLMHSDTVGKSAIYYFANGTLDLLWSSDHYKTLTSGMQTVAAPFDRGIVFTDWVDSTLRYYDFGTGGVSTIAAFTGGTFNEIGSSGSSLLFTNDTTSGVFFPDSVYPSSGFVSSSLIDFDSSLAKAFRGIKVDWQAATDGNGGSVDISYQVDSLDGAYTSLQTGAVTGTEYLLSGITGHAISVKITINKGTSTLGPILKRVYVRAAPALQQFKSGLYVIDCTGTAEDVRELRDNQYHPLTGYDQVQNLLTAAKATTPFTVVDKVNGSFTALVDLSDQEGWDVYEVHPDPDNPKKPGSYLVRVKVREV